MQHVSTLGTTPHPLLSDRPPQRPSSQARKTLLWEYGIALLAVMTAVALRMALTPWLGTRVPFITLFPAAAVAVWYGGYRPALVAALLGYAAVDYFIRDPATPMGVPTNAASFVAYSLSCGIIIAFGEGMRRSRSRLQFSESGLQRQVEALTKLHELSLRVAATDDLNAALSAILRTLYEIHRASSGVFALYDVQSRRFTEAASLGLDPPARETVHRVMFGAHGELANRALAAGRRTVVFDVEKDPNCAGYRDAARAAGFRAMHSTPIVTRDGNLLGVVSLFFPTPREPDELEIQFADMCARYAAEVIESRRAKLALQQSEAQLRQQAAELEQQLIASGRLVSIGELTAALAHEINNPLGIMMGFAQDLGSDKPPDHPDYRPLSIIFEEGKRCQKIVAELVEFSRPQLTNLKQMRLADSVEKALSFVRPRLYGQKIDISVAVADVPVLSADPVQIEQVLVNLFLNAIDAMSSGGALTVRAGRAHANGQDVIRIAVSDTGIGIAEQSLP